MENIIKKIGGFINRYKVLLGFLLAGLILFFYNYNNYTAYVKPAAQEFVTQKVGKKNGKFETLKEGERLNQEFFVKDNLFQGIRVALGGEGQKKWTGTIKAELYGRDDKECLAVQEIQLEQLKTNYFDVLLDKPQKNVQGNQYFLHLEVESLKEDTEIYFYSLGDGYYNDGMLLLNGEQKYSDLYFEKVLGKAGQLRPMSLVIFAVTAVGLVVVFWIIYKKKMKIWNIVTVMALITGMLYSLMVTPMAAPDEVAHYYTTYRISNKMMGISERDKDHVTMRKDDSEIEGFSDTPSAMTYMTAWEGMSTPLKDKTLVQVEKETVGVLGYFYLPGAIGFTIARILGLGTVPMIYLGRLLNLLAYILLARAALKRIPFGKTLLGVIAVSPMLLHQVSSLNYDALIFGFAYLYIAQCMYLVYQEEHITAKQMLLLLVAGILLAPCKSGAYLPIAFLLLLLPLKKCKDKKQYALYVGGVLAVIVLAAVMNFVVTSAGITGTDGVHTVDWPGVPTETYAISFLWQQPLSFIRMMLRTICANTGNYITSMIGSSMGSSNIFIPSFWVLAYMFLLFAAGTKLRGQEQRVTPWHKVWMCVICAGVFFLIEVAMMIGWTPTYYAQIMGVQGRYFLPVLPLLMLVLQNDTIMLKKDQSQKLLASAFTINAAIVYIGFTLNVML